MTTSFLHGIEVIELDGGPRPISTVRSSVIGLIGTAPDAQLQAAAQVTVDGGALNTAIKYTAIAAGALGNEISVRYRNPGINSAPLTVSVIGKAITISLATSVAGAITSTATTIKAAVDANTAAAALVTTTHAGGSTGSGIIAATVAGSTRFLTGGTDEAFPLNKPVLILGSRIEAAKLGLTGTLPAAIDAIFDQAGAAVIVVRVAKGIDDAATQTNIIGGVNPTTGQYTGLQAFIGAESITKVAPKILIAPGFTQNQAVLSEMVGVADRLRAIIVSDGPNTTDQAAISYRENFGSARVYMTDPWVKVWDPSISAEAVQPLSARAAGAIVRSDNERGWWWSPSNLEIYGITGTARPIDFVLGDPNTRANFLNENEVATVIQKDGYRLFGNRTCSADPKWAFLSVRRTADMINESLLRAHMWAVDRNIGKAYVQEVLASVNAYLDHLTAIDAILGGRAWADPDLNTASQITQGNVYFDFDFSAAYPAEHITFRSRLVNDYLEEVFLRAA